MLKSKFLKTLKSLVFFSCLLVMMTLSITAQIPPTKLEPNQTVEREMTGAETHRYQFELKPNEFFQVRVEQKGIDILLKLSDEKANVLVTMDSPNGKEGVEILTFVPEKKDLYVLEVINQDEKAEKGIYLIKRASLRNATLQDKRRIEVEKIFVEGIRGIPDRSKTKNTLGQLETALKGWKDFNDDYLIELTEKAIVNVKNWLYLENLITEFKLPGKLLIEAEQLQNKGNVESLLAARSKYLEALEASRKFSQRLNNEPVSNLFSEKSRTDWRFLTKENETNVLGRIGTTYSLQKDWKESIRYNKFVVELIEEIRQNSEFRLSEYFNTMPFPLKLKEADAFGSIGTGYINLSNLQEALIYNNKSLTLWQEIEKEHVNYIQTAQAKQVLLLVEFAHIHRQLNEPKKALEIFEQSLAVVRKIPNQKNLEASISAQIGDLYFSLMNYVETLKYLESALKISAEIGDKPGQASNLKSIGLVYLVLNQKQKFQENFNQVLKLYFSDDYFSFSENEKPVIPLPSEFKNIESPNTSAFYKDQNEWSRHLGIGETYKILGEKERHLEYAEKSLAFARSTKNQEAIRLSLSSIGQAYTDKKDWQKALDYYKQSLEISRQLSDKKSVASDLSSISYLYYELKNWKNALEKADESILIYQSLGADKSSLFMDYATILNTKSNICYKSGNRRLAILYGKQAINAIQRERQQLHNLRQESQRGYLKNNEKLYRRLAEWLIESGRLIEAEQVLAMLKEEEADDYLRRNLPFAEKLNLRLELTPTEKRAFEDYQKKSETIAAIGLDVSKLEDLMRSGTKLTTEQEKQFEELKNKQTEANKNFQNFLNSLTEEFENNKNPEKDLRENYNLQSELESYGDGVAFVYTLVGEDTFSSILVTPNSEISEQKQTTAAELNKKIFAFREAVKNPGVDPRPPGKELYDILIAPIEKNLEAAKTKTILWYLDGNLRLLPLAALWDGKQYFGQKYQNVVLTGKSIQNIGADVSTNPSVLALGVSEPKTVPETLIERRFTFSALPFVLSELGSIVRTAKSPKGVLSGESFLNAEFTRKSFAEQLLKKYKIVHIASHFSINSGDASRSFLLLGDGDTLPVSELNINPLFKNKFASVELLTLSACDTAVGETESNGREVEGFAYVAQQNGAKAILATLWSVADESTSLLMSEFYRRRKENPKITKAEAMQNAQQAMINGKLEPSGNRINCRSDVINLGEKQTEFKCNSNAPFSHPYYWSPFVLIGNWK